MDKREIMDQTIKNMRSFYQDIAHISQLIENKLKNEGFKPIGDSGICWETSSSINYPDGWLNRWFARAYMRGNNKKTGIGFCIHIGGYTEEDLNRLDKLFLKFPFINISKIEASNSLDSMSRKDVYNALWAAGWYEPKKIDQIIIYADDDDFSTTTYFVDLFKLNTSDMIDKMVIDPLINIYNREASTMNVNLPFMRFELDTESRH